MGSPPPPAIPLSICCLVVGSAPLLLRLVVQSVYIQCSGIFLEEVTKASWMNSLFERGGRIASERH